MPKNNTHAYMTRNKGDMQMQNPKNPFLKYKSANKKAELKTESKDGPTTTQHDKKDVIGRAIDKGTTKGIDTHPGPHGLGEVMRKLVKMKGKDVTKTSY